MERLKKRIILTVAFCAAFSFCADICAQTAKYDPHRYNQIASMEFKQWHFTPERYYYSWYDQKINLGLFSITVRLPGLGKHDNGFAGIGFGGDGYVNERWRQMTPLRGATYVEAALEEKERAETTHQWKGLAIADGMELADNMADLTGAQSSVRARYSKCKDRLSKLVPYLSDSEVARAEDQLQLIKETIDDISNSGMGSVRREKGYKTCRRQLEALENKYFRIAKENELRKFIY